MKHLTKFNESESSNITKTDLEDVVMHIHDKYGDNEDVDIEYHEDEDDRVAITFYTAKMHDITSIEKYNIFLNDELVRADILKMLKFSIDMISRKGYLWELKTDDSTIVFTVHNKSNYTIVDAFNDRNDVVNVPILVKSLNDAGIEYEYMSNYTTRNGGRTINIYVRGDYSKLIGLMSQLNNSTSKRTFTLNKGAHEDSYFIGCK